LPGTVYTSVAQQTGGTVASICSADLSGVLGALADESIDWQTVFELQASAVVKSLRVSVDDERQSDGWTYQETPPAVVFDTPPAPDAEIAIRYWLAESGS
jgi:hypothetical protein